MWDKHILLAIYSLTEGTFFFLPLIGVGNLGSSSISAPNLMWVVDEKKTSQLDSNAQSARGRPLKTS